MKVKGEENQHLVWEDEDEDEEGWDFSPSALPSAIGKHNMEDLEEWINAIFHLPAPVNPRDTALDGEQSDMRHITVSTEIVARDTRPSHSLFLSLPRRKKNTQK